MSNHAHLLLQTPDANLAVGMHWFGSAFARRFNRRHGRVGHFFERRYGRELLTTDSHLLAVWRYIVLNPVRARIVPQPGRYLWSSYRATAGLVPGPAFLDDSPLLEVLGDDPFVSRSRFVAFVADGVDDPLLGTAVS